MSSTTSSDMTISFDIEEQKDQLTCVLLTTHSSFNLSLPLSSSPSHMPQPLSIVELSACPSISSSSMAAHCSSFYSPPPFDPSVSLVAQGGYLPHYSPLLSYKQFSTLVNLSRFSSFEGAGEGLPQGLGRGVSRTGEVVEGLFRDGMLVTEDECKALFHFQNQCETYEGDIQEGFLTGKAKLTFLSGAVYEGQVREGRREGAGEYVDDITNRRYQGEWLMGKKHGQGTVCFDRALTTYVGEFKHGLREGTGTMTWPSGNTYTGKWRAGRKEGIGRMDWRKKGEVYEGEWKDNLPEGKGRYTYSTRSKSFIHPIDNIYVGEMRAGLRHGHGSFFYADSSSYHGSFVRNEKHGHGVYTWPNGTWLEADFVHDQCVDGRYKTIQIDSLDIDNLNDLLCTESDACKSKSDLRLMIKRHLPTVCSLYKLFFASGEFVMRTQQLWLAISELNLLEVGLTLAEVDRLCFTCGANAKLKRVIERSSIHAHDQIVWLREFVHVLIRIAHRYAKSCFHDNADDQSLSVAYEKLIKTRVVPYLKRQHEPQLCSSLLQMHTHNRFSLILSRYDLQLTSLFEQQLSTKCMFAKSTSNEDCTTNAKTFLAYLSNRKCLDSTMTRLHVQHLLKLGSPESSQDTLYRELNEWEWRHLLVSMALYRLDIHKAQTASIQQRELERIREHHEKETRKREEAETALLLQQQILLALQQSEAQAEEEATNKSKSRSKAGGVGAKKPSSAKPPSKTPLSQNMKKHPTSQSGKKSSCQSYSTSDLESVMAMEDINGICEQVLDEMCDRAIVNMITNQPLYPPSTASLLISPLASTVQEEQWSEMEENLELLLREVLN